MQIEQVQRKVEMEGFDQEEQQFSIQNSSLAFKILSDKLYSDKPMAVIRELGCNAWDAHVAAGNDTTPFDVHLPNHFEPFFSIRDYGTGLSDSDIKGLYTTYFDSTKRNTNKAVGMLGLGSKSPFSYADQFNVTSYFNGTRSLYVAYINPNGVPSLKPVSSEPTTEPNGIEIDMGVSPDDFSVFADRARKVFHRFPVLPNLKGNKDADLTQVKYTITGPNYKVRSYDERYQYGEHRGAYAVQGTVAYPLNFSRINVEMTNKEQSLLRDLPVDIIFEIGELDIAPSREELSYDKRTQENIVNKLREVLAHIPTHAKSVLADQKTLWDAKKTWARWRTENQGEAKFMKQVLDEVLEWNSQKISTATLKVVMSDVAQQEANNKLILKATSPDTLVLPKVDSYGDIAILDEGALDRKKSQANYVEEAQIKCSDTETVIVWLDDEKLKTKVARYAHYKYRSQDIKVYIIRPIAGFEQKIKDQLGGFTNFVLASTLEEPPKEVKDLTIVKREIRKLYLVKKFQTGWGQGMDKTETEHDVSEGGLYVVTYGGDIISPGGEWTDGCPPKRNEEAVKELLTYAQAAGLFKGREVYAFNSGHKSLIKKHQGWVNVFDLIKTEMTKKSMQKDYLGKFGTLVTYLQLVEKSTIGKEVFVKHTPLSNLVPHLKNPKSKFVSLMAQVKDIGKGLESFLEEEVGKQSLILDKEVPSTYPTPNLHNIRKLFEVSNTVLGTRMPELSQFIKKADQITAEFRALYPMLGLAVVNMYCIKPSGHAFATGRLESDQEGVALYINLCDKGSVLTKEYKAKHLN